VNFSVDDTTQEFYVPHVELGRKLITQFRVDPVKTVNAVPNDVMPIYGLLKRLMCGSTDDDVSVTPCSRDDLQEAVKAAKERGPLLVFIDEVPREESGDAHDAFMHLRSVLRRVGVCPVTMSTHAGAMAPSTSSSYCRLGLSASHVQRVVVHELPWYEGAAGGRFVKCIVLTIDLLFDESCFDRASAGKRPRSSPARTEGQLKRRKKQ